MRSHRSNCSEKRRGLTRHRCVGALLFAQNLLRLPRVFESALEITLAHLHACEVVARTTNTPIVAGHDLNQRVQRLLVLGHSCHNVLARREKRRTTMQEPNSNDVRRVRVWERRASANRVF